MRHACAAFIKTVPTIFGLHFMSCCSTYFTLQYRVVVINFGKDAGLSWTLWLLLLLRSFYDRASQPFLLLVPLSQVRAFLVPPKKFLRYILLYKRYISCSVTQGSSYPLMFNLVPLGGTSTPGWEPLFYDILLSPFLKQK